MVMKIWRGTLLIISSLVLILAGCGQGNATIPASPPLTPIPSLILPSPEITQFAGSTAVDMKAPDFVIESINLSPESPLPGKDFTIEAVIRNAGNASGTYTGKFTIDGKAQLSEEVTVEVGGSQSITLTTSISETGMHTVEIAGIKYNFKVLKPAEFQATDMNVVPSSILTGDSTAIDAIITNTGEIEDTRSVALLVDKLQADFQMVTLKPGASTKVSFNLKTDEPGYHNLVILDAAGTVYVKILPQYTSKTYFYSIGYAPGATVNEIDPATVAIEQKGIGGLTILVDRIPVAETPKSYFEDIARFKKKQLPDWAYNNLAEITENGTAAGYSYDYTNTADGKKWIGKGRIVKKAGFGFYITYTTLQSEWDNSKKLAERCLQSFKTPEFITGTYQNKDLNLSMVLPPDWSAAKPAANSRPDLVLACFAPYNKNLISGGLVIKYVTAGTTAREKMGEGITAGLNLGLVKVLSQGSFTFNNGTNGYEVIQISAIPEFDLKSISISLVKGDGLYEITFTGPAKDVDPLIDSIEQLAKSLVVK
jgi:hypothetical protein